MNPRGLAPALMAAAAVFAAMTVLWIASVTRKDASIVDVFWGLGFVLIAAILLADGSARPAAGRAVLALMVAAWGVRLGAHLYLRNRGKGEDYRSDRRNEGQVMDRGLWRYTRHPNYFGDTMVWWGIYLVSLANGAPWWSAAGPVLMTVLLMRVSGVTLLERKLVRTKPHYAEYARRTSAFLPWFPKH